MKEIFFNRELSWLKFNQRVLNESENPNEPLLERLKFIAIYGINLDEFYMIRVAGLKKLYNQGFGKIGIDLMTPKEQLLKIEQVLREQKKTLEKSYFQIRDALKDEGLHILSFQELGAEQKKRAEEYFYANLYPVIVPLVVDFVHPFPHLNNLSFGIVLRFQNITDPQVSKFALIRIPRFFPRFVEVGAGQFVLCESIVGEFSRSIFEGYDVKSWCPFRITRNADLEIQEEEADDFIELLNESLKARKNGEIVRLQVGRYTDEALLDFLKTHIPLQDQDIFQYDLPLNLGALWEIVTEVQYPHLRSPHFQPVLPKSLQDCDIFEVLDQRDVMLFHPYESFDPVVQLIEQASCDPDVLSIKMTLYRVGKDSPIVEALIRAAEHKQVNVLVELKARFDEENNLEWVKALEEAGAHVLYGATGLKVHSKIALVLKRDANMVRGYIHISTGNYNIKSAKVYTDVSLLSSRMELVEDGVKFFHSLCAGLANETRLKTIFMAPLQIKQEMLRLIAEEQRQGEKGEMILKMNALVDEDIINALCAASCSGVKITLIVRGICALRPKLRGVSENIRVISIIGRFLEHARIYYFKHSGVFFSSADMMTRNLQRRVELLVPIEDAEFHQRLLEFLEMQSRDNVGAYELGEDGEYSKILGGDYSSQKELEKLMRSMQGK
ncbi:RNA degradosome polyphosphate kinase [Helicobacter enhydrae]|uniref:Polyphosphate kinase n=1 Tax=Helicobacter enhydrae TaxID=222136 RepID=A0A1B1U5C9_9HELI|nr:polyphosphate kinase 1 [Helicobacter enhydrae]ANV97960.1 RNA degradosome polyphosphate kinase [Helicobacter enhydrae]